MSLARRMPSSSSAKRRMPATGPKVSSCDIAMSSVTPVSSVGSKNRPPRSWRRRRAAPRRPWRARRRRAHDLLEPCWSISGPTSTPCSVPGPTRSARDRLARSARRRRRGSPSCTSRRLAAMQTWPALRNLQMIAPATAASRSASSKTRNGALPPSSSESFLTCPAHCAISSLPTAVEPVKPILRTIGLPVSSPPIAGASSASPVTTGRRPPECPRGRRARPARAPRAASARRACTRSCCRPPARARPCG